MRKVIFLAPLLALLAQPAAASDAQMGKITTLFATSNGALIFSTNGSRTPPPSCGASLPLRFAIDASTVSGQVAASALLSAYAMGRRVQFFGTGTCTIWPDTETVNILQVED